MSPVWNAYGCAIGASSCGCWGYHPRPLQGAWEFWRIGFPFWLLAFAAASELLVRARYTREKVRAGTS